MSEAGCHKRTENTDSAGVITPPPLLYLGSLASGVALNLFFAMPLSGAPLVLQVLGFLLAASGAFIARWSFVTMKRMGTSADPRKSSMALATGGPFRISRNPIYLAMTMLYVGACLLLNSFWPLAFLIPLVFLMHYGVITREEKYLEEKFGKPYLEYKSKTRRWF